MNRISISKNFTKKISVFFLLFFVLISFLNSSKAQNVSPSDLKLFLTDSNNKNQAGLIYIYYNNGANSIEVTTFNIVKKQYLNTIQYKNGTDGAINDGYLSVNVQNLYKEINSLSTQFDSTYSTLNSNTKNLGIDKNFQNLIVASYVFKEITDPIITEIDNLNNNSNTTSVETDIYNNLKDSINSTTDKNFAQINADYSTEVRVMDNTSKNSYIKKYQLNKTNNTIVDLTGQNINADYSSSILDSNIKSFSSIIDDVLNVIDIEASPDKYKNNKDIINLKNVASTSKDTFNTAIQKINTAIQNSNNTQASTEVRINLARKDALSSLDSAILTYLNASSSKKAGNENVYNAYSASKYIVEKWINNASTTIADAGINYDSTTNTINQTNKADCDSEGFWKTAFSVNSNCSIGAYLINIMIKGINSLVNIVVNLVGALFDWIYKTGVIDFKSWVEGSGAYTIYKTIILSLIVSVMTFFVFYLIIRRLIDDDGEKMNKILPRLILTALFVYFSFTITGWIIDQSNIITIYLYRSMTHNSVPAQSIGQVFKSILSLENGGANSGSTGITDNFGISLGSWNAIPFTLGQLVVSIVGVFVLFQGAILILSRTIILLLCMIFSPIMLLPEGLTDFTDKYRKLVTDNFTGNVLLGPVFMFLVLLAVQIGQETTKWMTSNSPSFDNAGVAVPTNFLGGIISSVLVIVVLQLAISASKSLSGSAGEKLSGVIGKYAGGAAFGGGAKILRNTIGRGAAVAKDRGWMMGKEGSARHKFMTGLYNGAAKSTFDARNTETFKSAANFSGAGANSFGQGANKNYNDSFKAKLYNANKYHNSLDEVGKQRNINRLKNLGSGGDIDSKRIAESLEKKWKPSINERLNNDTGYNERFDKAHNEKDEIKRKTETDKVVNEHFKENGLGATYFSKKISKPENNKIKQEYDEALKEKDPIKRKETLTKVITDLDKKNNPNEGSVSSLVEAIESKNTNNNSSSQNTTPSSGPKPSKANPESMNSLRSRLQEKYSKQDVNESRQKRMTMYQEKSIKEAKEKQDSEISAEKEKNGGFIPSAKDLDAQSSLKNRLKEKYSKQDVADYRKNQENIYQEKLIKEVKGKRDSEITKNKKDDEGDEGDELSNSYISNEPPTIILDTGAGNKIDIPLTKEDGKPNIIQGDTKIFSQN